MFRTLKIFILWLIQLIQSFGQNSERVSSPESLKLLKPTRGRTLLYVCAPELFLAPSGTRSTIDNHFDYFKSREIDVVLLLMTSDPRAEAKYSHHPELLKYPCLGRIFITPTYSVWNWAKFKQQYELGISDTFFATLEIPDATVNALKSLRPIALLTNYAFTTTTTTRIAKQLRIPALCEIHDFFNQPGELELLDQFDILLNVSHEEDLLLKQKLTHAISHYIPQYVNRTPTLPVSPSQWDLTFVSTKHTPNLKSFEWFYDSVYKPYLEKSKITVAVVGNIYEKLNLNAYPSTFKFLKIVPDLDSIFSKSKINILPIQQGTGLGIKTLEAFAREVPFVATTLAYRGIPHAKEKLPTFDQPKDFAAEILKLLSDPEYLKARQALYQSFSREFLGRNHHQNALDLVFQKLAN